ncbi:MAG: hypothetical protein QOJ04_3436, partial [Caballeronia sp.]|nr:hypothetical protein [Caballeronia sp.]
MTVVFGRQTEQFPGCDDFSRMAQRCGSISVGHKNGVNSIPPPGPVNSSIKGKPGRRLRRSEPARSLSPFGIADIGGTVYVTHAVLGQAIVAAVDLRHGERNIVSRLGIE